MEFFDYSAVNWLAIPVSAFLYMVVGGIWYGPIAGKAWMAEMGLTQEDVEGGSPATAMVKSLIAAFFFATGLAVVVYHPALSVDLWYEGGLIGVFLAILIVGGATFPNYAFENKTLKHFLIHMGATTIAMFLMGSLMAVWR